MNNIDFSPPPWLINAYHIIGLIALLSNALGTYLLLFQNEKMGSFRYNLLVYQVFCTMLDIHLTFLMQPIPLYPLWAGYTVGLLQWLFGLSPHYCLSIAICVGICQLGTLNLCFAKKHQVVAKLVQKPTIPLWLDILQHVILVSGCLTVAIWLQFVELSPQQKWDFIIQNCPQYLENFKALPDFTFYGKSLHATLLLLFLLSCGTLLFIIFITLSIDLFRLMTHLKTRISPTTYQKHQEAVRSLMVQLVTTGVWFSLPCGFVVAVIMNIEHLRFLAQVMICVFCCYSTLNVSCLIVFFPPYRRFFKKKFARPKVVSSAILI